MIPLTDYLAELTVRKQTLQLQLNEINTQMANIRANYSQRRSNLFFKPSAHSKDHQLRKLQPTKQRLQAEILAVRTEITRIQALKKQGISLIDNTLSLKK